MNPQYIYPQNLKAQARLWLWNLRDIAILGIALLISLLALSQLKFVLPLALTVCYGFLTMRFDDTSVMDYIKRGLRYFVTTQQLFKWRMR
ncbi:MAG: hypothetical protein PHV32_04380 [Eubacteriales bacterium]|nr:hypothetical protein [Eubacteriales bacterium]